MRKNTFQQLAKSTFLLSALTLATQASATEVTFDTSEGTIVINLFDNDTPKTVTNFLSYVNNGSYNNSVIHRSIPGFIIQGGGYAFEGAFPLVKLPTMPSVVNEPVYSNRRGTISMAKIGGQPNSATNQWFFNLADNSANLDVNESGYTVFGQVTEGMDVIDKVAGFETCSDIPTIDFECADTSTPSVETFVTIYSATISDTSIDSAAQLNPVKNISTDDSDNDKDSGGSLSIMSLLTLGLLSIGRGKLKK